MATFRECFSIGSIVSCTTCFDQIIEGEVLAFDQNTKMLIIRRSSLDHLKLSDVFITNLSLCSDVQVKKEVITLPEIPKSLNLQRLTTRVRNAVEQKKRLVSALAAGVSPEGQKLYMVISKTIHEVTWSGPNIKVFNDVTIAPPYKVENVCGDPESRQFEYTKKIVEKFINDQGLTSSSNTGITASTTDTLTTSTGVSVSTSQQQQQQQSTSSSSTVSPSSSMTSVTAN